MYCSRSRFKPAIAVAVISAFPLLLQACSDSQESGNALTENSASKETQSLTAEAGIKNAQAAPELRPSESNDNQPQTANVATQGSEAEDDNRSGEPSAETPEDVQEIDPDSLEVAGQVELKHYSVAWGGSGTIGGGTLFIDEKSYPFKIVGLGIGGFGASSVEAKGVVYNLPVREDFAGTYGNARLGMTAGDSGGGKLWLRNSDGVVMELESEMRGLALAGGIDGLVIQWEEDDKSSADDAMEGTEEAIGRGIDAGADAVETGIIEVKSWFNKDDE